MPVGEKLNFGSRQEAPEVFSINTLCWIYSRNAILKEKKRIPYKTTAFEFDEGRSIDIDTEFDLTRLKEYAKNINRKIAR